MSFDQPTSFLNFLRFMGLPSTLLSFGFMYPTNFQDFLRPQHPRICCSFLNPFLSTSAVAIVLIPSWDIGGSYRSIAITWRNSVTTFSLDTWLFHLNREFRVSENS